MVAVLVGELPADGGVEGVRVGHEMVAAAPVYLEIIGDVLEMHIG